MIRLRVDVLMPNGETAVTAVVAALQAEGIKAYVAFEGVIFGDFALPVHDD